ncbi:ribonuclease H-like protein [Paxillus ammoniavirescens]|nr:ribonuclease H-like protein [Paxillus ammoniavirescens]
MNTHVPGGAKGTSSPPIQKLPLYSWQDRIPKPTLSYITSHEVANAQLAHLPHGPLGFDLEWRPNFYKGQRENPVAVVQLATSDTIILLQISAMSEFPAQLENLLNSSSWLKAGVSIQKDCEKLYKDYGVSVYNCVELSLLARTVDNARWKGKYTAPLGLARLLETYERATLPKGKVQRSNWELPLSQPQQEYAANDAYAGYVIYSHLYDMAQAMNPVPPPAYYSFSVVGGILRDHVGVSRWQPQNPFYDPGPPPPPKEPKNPDEKKQHQGSSTALQRPSSGVVQTFTHQSSFASSTMAVTSGAAIPVASSRLPFRGGQYIADNRARYHTESGGARERPVIQAVGPNGRRRNNNRRPRPPIRADADTA